MSKPLVRLPNAVPASGSSDPDSGALATLPDDELLEAVQRQTFRYFWEGAHPASGLAPDRRTVRGPSPDDPVTIGGSGFGVMALLVAVERGWITRAQGLARLACMLEFLGRAPRYHGAFAHYLDGRTGATVPLLGQQDDGGDLVETALLCMGLLCARQYFQGSVPAEVAARERITALYEAVEWDWYTRGADRLYWHWSPTRGWALDLEIRGWNECLVAYVLAAGAPRHAIAPATYRHGFAAGPNYRNGQSYYDIELPLGPPFGGPLFFAHYSFCGLDPRGLGEGPVDYWQQNVAHVRIHRAHAIANPHGHRGYGADCWGFTASDEPGGYAAHEPARDNGTIAPTAALASLPYAPREVLQVLRHLLAHHGAKLWGRYGFVDAFCEGRGWYADTCLAIDQGPIVIMFENQRSGLLWKLFMTAPEVRRGLRVLGIRSPWLVR